ncbi:MFS transporter [Gordonia sp. VNK1]|uniref:MFS transporter n=1 Tax=Gordonia oleivorans TaxID=3156618 RepID=UPI0032B37DA6
MTATRRSAATVALGTAVEGYDWVTFLALLPYLTKGPLAGVSSPFTTGFVIFALGFAARPVGALVFGRLADRVGRSYAFRAALAVSTVTTGAMAFIPSGLHPSWLAPLLILVLRMALGAAHGGLAGVVNASIYEIRDVMSWEPSVLVYAMGAAGKVLSLIVTLVMASALTTDQMIDFGWRVPYLVGGVGGVALLVYSLGWYAGVGSSDARTGARNSDVPDAEPAVARGWLWRRMAVVAGLSVGTTAAYNIWIAAVIPYATEALGVQPRVMFWVSLVQTCAFAVIVVGTSRLIRRWSLHMVYRRAAIAGLVVSPAVLALTAPSGGLGTYVAGLAIATVILAILCAALPGVLASLFPADVRAVGNGVPYAVIVALVGGTAPGLRDVLADRYWVFGVYLVALCAVSAIVARRTTPHSLQPREQRVVSSAYAAPCRHHRAARHCDHGHRDPADAGCARFAAPCRDPEVDRRPA